MKTKITPYKKHKNANRSPETVNNVHFKNKIILGSVDSVVVKVVDSPRGLPWLKSWTQWFKTHTS